MLTLQIKEKEIENLTPEEEFVRGTVGAKCQINFDEFWQGYEKYIVFKRVGYEPINIMVDSLENEIEIPYTILAEIGEFKIGVFGITETETLPTLYSKDIKILYGTDTHGTTPPTYTPSEIDQLRLLKQDKLVSGENIKTINGESVLGKGDIKVQIEVDQTYSPESKNAQSGKAVAEAVAIEQKRSDNTFANALKGTKTDTAILLDDVSPVTHDMSVKVRGKNLLPLADSGIYYKGSISGGQPFIADKRFGISSFNNIDISIYRGVYAIIKLKEEETYTLTIKNLVNNCVTKQIKLAVGFRSSESTILGTGEKNNCKVSEILNPSSLTFTVPSGFPYCLVGLFNYPTVSGDTISFDAMQLELGTSATDYTPYVPDLTAVKVSRYGKNLFDISSSRGFENPYHQISNTINGNVITITSTADATAFLELGTFPKGTYTLSFNGREESFKFIEYGSDFTNTSRLNDVAFQTSPYTFTLKRTLKIWLHDTGFSKGTSTLSNIQLELNSTATDYEEFNRTDYTSTADGTVEGVTSLYPNTTLMTDTDGVIIDCEYNRDINKAFAELQQAIISLGGNV